MADERVQRLLSFANLVGEGLEVGPLSAPLVAKDGRNRIYYADYADQEFLRKCSENNPHVNCAAIPIIDYVVKSTADYQKIERRFDYILAAHVIEHTPDFIGWINALICLLKPKGKLILAIPDRRYTFDYFRPESSLGDALDAYYEKRVRPTFRQVFDGFDQARKVDTSLAWDDNYPIEPERYYTRAQAFNIAKSSFDSGTHSDCHCWVFTMGSFLSIVAEAAKFGALKAVVQNVTEPVNQSNEFHVVLIPNGSE